VAVVVPPGAGGAGLYITSVTRMAPRSKVKRARLAALHTPLSSTRAVTSVVWEIDTGPLYTRAPGATPPPGRRGSEPSSV
jgi:hypothetical protein